MRQLVQLQEHRQAFKQAGIGVVAMTYDAEALQQAFVKEQNLDIPLLSDIDATSFTSLGILNTDYEPGDDNYGIPWPGIFIVDPRGEIRGKLFLEGYATRVDSVAVLNYAQGLLDPPAQP